eukprot:TRINITY_DN953_c0_g1_i1.p1 TRINITY_DN953_c0_g1~~TRINITY_DN953_c0_g1_i1.p1  ORF type:complete len:440 (-),score=50.20 TRINITY_DN953_c0_g1_i1:952-2271(-)
MASPAGRSGALACHFSQSPRGTSICSGHAFPLSSSSGTASYKHWSLACHPGAAQKLSLTSTVIRMPSGTGGLVRGSRLYRTAAIDAAQLFDYESKQQQEIEMESKLKVGIVGFGNFGQFLASRFAAQGHHVMAHSRSDYSDLAAKIGVSYFRDPDDFCEEHPDVVVLCTSILSTEAVLSALPVGRLKRSTLFVDVLSVKEFPKSLFLQVLPADFDILCTHPMFGPESGKDTWAGLPFVYEKVRIGPDRSRSDRCDKFLKVFENEGCRMVEMSCSEHDRFAAGSQFITHTVGRVLGKLALESTPINTKGYETLLRLVENTSGDSYDLYYGLFMYNTNATEQLERLELAFDSVKKQLFGQLHNVLRHQLFDGTELKGLSTMANVNLTPAVQNGNLPKKSATLPAVSSNSSLLSQKIISENGVNGVNGVAVSEAIGRGAKRG